MDVFGHAKNALGEELRKIIIVMNAKIISFF